MFDIEYGYTFPKAFRIFGVLILVAGVGMLTIPFFYLDEFESSVPIIVFIVLGFSAIWLSLQMLTSKEGVEIYQKKNRFRIYTTFLKKRKGDWKEMDQYPYISILRKQYKEKINTFRTRAQNFNTPDLEIDHIKYNIYLLNGTHFKKVFLQSFNTEQEAQEKIKELSNQLGLEITTYAPKVARRRR